MVSQKMKEYVTEVKRGGDRLMTVRPVYGECAINMVSAYAPQSGEANGE